MSSNGIMLRTDVNGISKMGRATRGVRIMNLQNGDAWPRWRCSPMKT
jgi:DNA gyrase/topoisomerase IV subunit A